VSKRAAIIYRNDDAPPCFRIGYANLSTEWQRSMCCGKTAAPTRVISGHPRKALTCCRMDRQRSYGQNDRDSNCEVTHGAPNDPSATKAQVHMVSSSAFLPRAEGGVKSK